MTMYRLSLSFAFLAACASAPKPMPEPVVDPGPIRPPDALPYDFQWNQRVTAIWPSGQRTFDAVLQKRNGELILVGLSPMGLPGFVLRLAADAKITVENRTGRDLPFAPEYILADVERVFFPWLPPEGQDRPERAGAFGPLHVVERYAGGRLVGRTFTRTDGAVSGSVEITYQPLKPGEDASRRVEVANGWFGYRLIIETLEQSRLGAR